MSRLKSNCQASAGRPALHALAGAALILFAATGLLRNAPAQAQAIAPSTLSNAAGKKPLLDAASNGVPIVNIATPSSGGVSHNLFSQFNMGANGVILNNRAVVGISTLGGTIAGNLQLQASPPARLVLAEVDSTNPSQLLGRLEVVGNKAEFVLANTNGITCNGCGFINTSRAVLATGRPDWLNGLSGGTLSGYNVAGGVVQIGAGGLNASGLGDIGLIGGQINIAGNVFDGGSGSTTIFAIAGANRVDHE